jgi:hypothetical protein
MKKDYQIIKNEPKNIIFHLSKVKRANNWTKQEDTILLEKAKQFQYKNWKAISTYLPGRTDIQCSARYKRIRPGIIKGPWTATEDKQLLELVKTFGKNWSLLSKYMPSRNGKQIRDRYLNNLDPLLKKHNFTAEEDRMILELYIKHGACWSRIAKSLEGRTGDTVKNRFYSTLKKRMISCKSELDDRTFTNESFEDAKGISIKGEVVKKELENQMALLINVLNYTQSRLDDINNHIEIDVKAEDLI